MIDENLSQRQKKKKKKIFFGYFFSLNVLAVQWLLITN